MLPARRGENLEKIHLDAFVCVNGKILEFKIQESSFCIFNNCASEALDWIPTKGFLQIHGLRTSTVIATFDSNYASNAFSHDPDKVELHAYPAISMIT